MRINKNIFLVSVLVGIVFVISGGRAEAAKTFDSESHSPASHRALCIDGSPVDFSAYPSDVSLDSVTGVMSYNINVLWGSCNSTDTRAYAVYSIGQEMCPISGTYGASDVLDGLVTDCVKYVGNPPYQGSANNLTCTSGLLGAPGVNEQCVTESFTGVRREENTPTSSNNAIIPMQTIIPNWSLAADVGSWTVSNDLCQFYKTGASFATFDNNRCINLSVTVTWRETVIAPQISCGSIGSNPSSAEEGQAFNVIGSFMLSGAAGQTGQTTYSMTMSMPAAGIVNQAVAANVPIAWSGIEGTGTLADVTLPSAGSYPVSFSVNVAGASNSPQTCNGTITISSKPFLSVYGGDVSVGGDFGNTNCYRSSDIDTYTNSAMLGSGVQFGAFVMGNINGFSSARLVNPPKYLTFANTTAGLGGQFGAEHCIPDYFASSSTLTPSPDNTVDISTSGSKLYNGASTTLSGALADGVKLRVYVQGDLRITNNIDYVSSSWPNVGAIPSLQVFVSGNIYVDPNVSRITGMFVAQPRTGVSNSGSIITCAKNGNTTFAVDELYDSPCRSQLTIHGSLTANKIIFSRVANSLKDATFATESRASTSRGAEIFEFTPELYLSPKDDEVNSINTYNDKYDSITALPPFL